MNTISASPSSLHRREVTARCPVVRCRSSASPPWPAVTSQPRSAIPCDPGHRQPADPLDHHHGRRGYADRDPAHCLQGAAERLGGTASAAATRTRQQARSPRRGDRAPRGLRPAIRRCCSRANSSTTTSAACSDERRVERHHERRFTSQLADRLHRTYALFVPDDSIAGLRTMHACGRRAHRGMRRS